MLNVGWYAMKQASARCFFKRLPHLASPVQMHLSPRKPIELVSLVSRSSIKRAIRRTQTPHLVYHRDTALGMDRRESLFAVIYLPASADCHGDVDTWATANQRKLYHKCTRR